jgi:hypothetical protein
MNMTVLIANAFLQQGKNSVFPCLIMMAKLFEVVYVRYTCACILRLAITLHSAISLLHQYSTQWV